MEKNMGKEYKTQSLCCTAEIKHIVNQLYFNKIIFEKCCLTTQLCPTLCDPMDCSPPGCSVHGDSPGKNTGVGCHALLQGIFPTQGLNPGVPHCRQILYHLSHQGSPRMLQYIAYPFSGGSSWPRNQTGVSCRWVFLPAELPGKPSESHIKQPALHLAYKRHTLQMLSAFSPHPTTPPLLYILYYGFSHCLQIYCYTQLFD